VLTVTSQEKKQVYFGTVASIIAITALVLFFCSSLKYILFKSTAWDLGVFHQAVYLISQGQPPISSYLGYHILGDHAAWIWYPLALLYKIYPSVYWLFAVQAIALAISALPTWQATREAVALVQTKGAVLTTDEISPQLSDRPSVKLVNADSPSTDYEQFDYILLNVRHPGAQSNLEFAASMVNTLKKTEQFYLRFQRDEVYLFVKKPR
jgi:uncharacterized membrane protein